MADVLDRRLRERERLIALAASYVDGLRERLAVDAAVVVGSVARGDFNVWSDVDVLIVSDALPERQLDRLTLLGAQAPAGVQPIGFRPTELNAAARRANPLVLESLDGGVVLFGHNVLNSARAVARARASS